MQMELADTFWQVFIRSGHVGAYLLYKEYTQEDIGKDEGVIVDQEGYEDEEQTSTGSV